MAESLAICRSMCALYKPDFVAVPPWSPNDGASSAAAMDAIWVSVLDTLDYVMKLGCTPIMVTNPRPNQGYSDAAKALVQRQNDRVRSLVGSSVIVIDAQAALELNGIINPIYDSAAADQLHWNDLAHGVVGALVYNAIK